MTLAASSKYPCSRPATFAEYSEGRILGAPLVNSSGTDVCFVGPGGSAKHPLAHGTLGHLKPVVMPGDKFDGSCQMAAMAGTKMVMCVYPMDRVRKQPSLATFGVGRRLV